MFIIAIDTAFIDVFNVCRAAEKPNVVNDAQSIENLSELVVTANDNCSFVSFLVMFVLIHFNAMSTPNKVLIALITNAKPSYAFLAFAVMLIAAAVTLM